jgi:hypothetical protein
MNVPRATNPIWLKVITGEIRPDVQFLATKILLNKLTITYKMDQSNSTTQNGINELVGLFENNIQIQKVQDDLIKIFGKEKLS